MTSIVEGNVVRVANAHTDHEVEAVAVHAVRKVCRRVLGLFGVEELRTRGVAQGGSLAGHVKALGRALEQRLDVAGAQHVLPRALRAGRSHRHDGDLCRLPALDVRGDGTRVRKAPRHDLVRTRGVHDALRAGTRGVDARAARQVHASHLRWRVAIVEALHLPASALAKADPVRMRRLERPGLVHGPDGIDRLRTLRKQVALERERAEHVDHHREPTRLARALDKLQHPYVHVAPSAASCEKHSLL